MKRLAAIVWSRKNSILLLIFSLLRAESWLYNGINCNHYPYSRHLQQLSASNTPNNNIKDESSVHTLPRLYVGPDVRLSNGVKFVLPPDQAHYVTNVMRIGKKKSRNDSIRVFDGRNGEWLVQITIDDIATGAPQKRKRRRNEATVTAQCIRQLRIQEHQQVMEPWLFFAPIKKQRVKYMLEKCTELGVGRFVPIVSERAEPNCVMDVLRDQDKLAIQTKEASEQCERLTVPPLDITCIPNIDSDEKPWNLETLLKEWSSRDEFGNRHLLICREREADCSIPVFKLLQSILGGNNVTSVAFVVGPEGGWSRDENELLDHYSTSYDNINSISLGSLVLRAETAAIAATSAYMLCQEVQYDDTIIRKP